MFLKLMMVLSVLTSLGIGFISSPFVVCLMVVVLIGWGCGMVGVISSLWMGYALALVFLGGMMVLFTYASSMSTSDKFIAQGDWGILVPLGLVLVGWVVGLDMKMFMGSLYMGAGGVVLLISTLYLLSCLFMCVKLVEVYKGTLLV